MHSRRIVVFGSTGYLGRKVFTNPVFNSDQIIPVHRGEEFPSPPLPGNQNASASGTNSATELDGAVWIHGMNDSDSVAEYSETDSLLIFEANFFYTLRTMKALIANVPAKKALNLVVVSSIWANRSKKNKMSYSASKAALDSLVKSASVDLREAGISVVGIGLGVVESPMSRNNLPEESIAILQDRSPDKQLIDPGDLAKLISFLMSTSGRPFNGHTIPYDYGTTIEIGL